ncbi:hypothetical protein WJX73_010053 [Symbiochloris irregularis]|uniref:Cas1p 10 TM acyl transferase domain-containing protein n=1 Tax=Symbiochloris irregularis TaxID=706552 RepID=A0AAW1NVC8_9CHLO
MEMQGVHKSDVVAPVTPLATGQVAAAVLYAASFAMWLYAEYAARQKRIAVAHRHVGGDDDEEQQAGSPLLKESSGPKSGKEVAAVQPSLVRVLRLDREALTACRPTLRAAVEFGTIMLWLYLADRTTVFPTSLKSYSRDLLGFLFLVLTVVAGVTSLRPARTPLLLNRSQTEEWKGWMQVLFLLYHYFEAREVYNAIRVFIAGYVWMTGYNNFSYYYRTKDFNIARFCAMMWRLNFLVAAVCIVMRNSYMLYYICPMHTLFTVMVYALLGIGAKYNDHRWGVFLKFAISFVVVFVCWDIKAIFYALWGFPPLRWLMVYTDPRHPSADPLHEWYFRSSLDRYVWIHGMACAYLHPWAEARLQRLDKLTRSQRLLIRAALASAAAGVMLLWIQHVYLLPKKEYNALHPYTSWIPISAYIVLRNITPNMRVYSMALYGWLGRITLETYIGQFHTWLATGIPDGQPKLLLAFLPSGYPLLNFAATSAVYVFISYRLFHLTDSFRQVLIPDKASGRVLVRNAVSAASAAAVLCAVGALIVYWSPAVQHYWPVALKRDVGTRFETRL